jgi:hypothetical protein
MTPQCHSPGCTSPALTLSGTELAALRRQAPRFVGVAWTLYCADHDPRPAPMEAK